MRIYQLALEVVASVYRLAAEVQPRDKDLASQMRRACASMVLNMGEGMYSQGGRKVSRYFDSMGSARETTACLHICVAARLLSQAKVDADLVRLDDVSNIHTATQVIECGRPDHRWALSPLSQANRVSGVSGGLRRGSPPQQFCGMRLPRDDLRT